MKKLALGVFIVLAAACGSKSGNNSTITVTDSGIDGTMMAACSLLTQTGCSTGEKCTWIHDDDGSATASPKGHIGCAPAGALATGAACTYDPAPVTTCPTGMTCDGIDKCVGGDVCTQNEQGTDVCQQICDNAGGTPGCPTNPLQACITIEGLFAADGATSTPAGVCEPACNPLADNDFQGSATGTKAGSACGTSLAVGCYGFPQDGGSGSVPPTHFACAPPAGGYGSGATATGNFVHRSPSTLPASLQLFLNTCAPGYQISLLGDKQGSTTTACFSYCAPANSYMGLAASGAIPAGGQPNGAPPHRCNNTDSRGSFTVATVATNGEHCMYTWLLEIDPNTGMLHKSATSDTVGICMDHTKFQYDSNGDGTITAADMVWPDCATLPLVAAGGSQDPLFAGFFGCVDTVTGMVMFDGATGKTNFPNVLIQRPQFVHAPRSAH